MQSAFLREYRPSDLPEVAAIYREAVRGAAPELYTPEQVEAWAIYADHPRELAAMFDQGYRLVVENESGGLDAFAVLDPADYVSLLYSRVYRQGHAGRLLDALETEARRRRVPRVHTAASLISHPLFLRRGYAIDYAETVERHGVLFNRYRMSKPL